MTTIEYSENLHIKTLGNDLELESGSGIITVLNSVAPTASNHLATKQYVDDNAGGGPTMITRTLQDGLTLNINKGDLVFQSVNDPSRVVMSTEELVSGLDEGRRSVTELIGRSVDKTITVQSTLTWPWKSSLLSPMYVYSVADLTGSTPAFEYTGIVNTTNLDQASRDLTGATRAFTRTSLSSITTSSSDKFLGTIAVCENANISGYELEQPPALHLHALSAANIDPSGNINNDEYNLVFSSANYDPGTFTTTEVDLVIKSNSNLSHPGISLKEFTRASTIVYLGSDGFTDRHFYVVGHPVGLSTTTNDYEIHLIVDDSGSWSVDQTISIDTDFGPFSTSDVPYSVSMASLQNTSGTYYLLMSMSGSTSWAGNYIYGFTWNSGTSSFSVASQNLFTSLTNNPTALDKNYHLHLDRLDKSYSGSESYYVLSGHYVVNTEIEFLYVELGVTSTGSLNILNDAVYNSATLSTGELAPSGYENAEFEFGSSTSYTDGDRGGNPLSRPYNAGNDVFRLYGTYLGNPETSVTKAFYYVTFSVTLPSTFSVAGGLGGGIENGGQFDIFYDNTTNAITNASIYDIADSNSTAVGSTTIQEDQTYLQYVGRSEIIDYSGTNYYVLPGSSTVLTLATPNTTTDDRFSQGATCWFFDASDTLTKVGDGAKFLGVSNQSFSTGPSSSTPIEVVVSGILDYSTEFTGLTSQGVTAEDKYTAYEVDYTQSSAWVSATNKHNVRLYNLSNGFALLVKPYDNELVGDNLTQVLTSGNTAQDTSIIFTENASNQQNTINEQGMFISHSPGNNMDIIANTTDPRIEIFGFGGDNQVFIRSNGIRIDDVGPSGSRLNINDIRMSNSVNQYRFDMDSAGSIASDLLNIQHIRGFYTEQTNTSSTITLKKVGTDTGISYKDNGYTTNGFRGTGIAEAVVEVIGTGNTIHYLFKFAFKRSGGTLTLLANNREEIYNEWNVSSPTESAPSLTLVLASSGNDIEFEGTASDSATNTLFSVHSHMTQIESSGA